MAEIKLRILGMLIAPFVPLVALTLLGYVVRRCHSWGNTKAASSFVVGPEHRSDLIRHA